MRAECVARSRCQTAKRHQPVFLVRRRDACRFLLLLPITGERSAERRIKPVMLRAAGLRSPRCAAWTSNAIKLARLVRGCRALRRSTTATFRFGAVLPGARELSLIWRLSPPLPRPRPAIEGSPTYLERTANRNAPERGCEPRRRRRTSRRRACPIPAHSSCSIMQTPLDDAPDEQGCCRFMFGRRQSRENRCCQHCGCEHPVSADRKTSV